MSHPVLQRLNCSSLQSTTGLYADFLASPAEGLPQYLKGFALSPAQWRQAAEASRVSLERADKTSLQSMMDSLVGFNKRLGASADIIAKLETAGNGGTFFIVTGQQPGILGGPLMVAYKILTAVSLAKHLEKQLSVGCVPLYWCGSDDTDFHEIRRFYAFTRDLVPVRMSLPAQAHQSSRPVGAIPMAWPKSMWDNIAPVLQSFPSIGIVEGAVADSFARAEDHGESVSALLMELFKGQIAVVDGRAASVRHYAQPLFVDYLEREMEVKRLVRERGEALAKAGYHAQLKPSSDSGIFLMQKGRRRKVTSTGRPALEQAVRSEVEKCSPGVMLRNLVQDYTFRPLAVVLGPAELAYRAQMIDLYTLFAVNEPVPMPRMTATFIPFPILELKDAFGSDFEDLITAPRRFQDSVLKKLTAPEISEAKRRVLQNISKSLEEFLGELERTLSGDGAARFKAKLEDEKQRLAKTLNGLDAVSREAELKRRPWLADVAAVVNPNTQPQERIVSLLLPFLYAGDNAAEHLMKVSDHYVGDAVDGKPFHFVYSL